MTTVNVFMLCSKRDFYFHNETAEPEALEAFHAGGYEYTFTAPAVQERIMSPQADNDIWLCEQAYKAQGNNYSGTKVRIDREMLSEGDVVTIDGRAYVCARFGFVRVPDLDGQINQRIEAGWHAWTEERRYTKGH